MSVQPRSSFHDPLRNHDGSAGTTARRQPPAPPAVGKQGVRDDPRHVHAQLGPSHVPTPRRLAGDAGGLRCAYLRQGDAPGAGRQAAAVQKGLLRLRWR